MTLHKNFINGEWVEGKGTRDNINPSDVSDIVGTYAQADEAQARDAIAAAKAAFPAWQATTPQQRADALDFVGAELLARKDEVGRLLAREEGKPFSNGVLEVVRAAQIFKFHAQEALRQEGVHIASVRRGVEVTLTREPLGVVGLITPWNFPIAIPAWKIAPALAFGNTVVFKPASLTPLMAVRLVEALDEAGLPPGVLNLVTGSAANVGDPLVRDPRVVAITFTGSNETGAELRRSAAERGAKLQLELGGKNPAIVLADADLDHALGQVVAGAMMSTGQKCTATSRAIVDRRIIDRFTQMLADRIGGLKVGDPLDAETQIGPLIDDRAAERLAGEVDSAKQAGAELVVGGERLGSGLERGAFLAPTLFADVDPKSRLGQDELFGPVLGVIPVDSMEEAMAVANQVKFGLSASIFTRDLGRALMFAREIEAGVVHVNSETAGAEPQVPFGGMKGSSSYSREQGKSAREFFTQVKTVYIDPPPPAS
jgi:acyl-CoA reductase-like NAD-dependent aldehyde dehydrogenase